MNERIKELAEAAYRDVACNDTIGDTVSREAVDQKFAELIVRECITELRDAFDMTIEEGNHLKEHFGIEL
jgi:hypothetical protein